MVIFALFGEQRGYKYNGYPSVGTTISTHDVVVGLYVVYGLTGVGVNYGIMMETEQESAQARQLATNNVPEDKDGPPRFSPIQLIEVLYRYRKPLTCMTIITLHH